MVVHLQDPIDPLHLAGCLCPTCGYQLKGLKSCRCPECGNAFSLKEVRNVHTQEPGASWLGFALCALISLILLIMSMTFLAHFWGGALSAVLLGAAVWAFLLPLIYKYMT